MIDDHDPSGASSALDYGFRLHRFQLANRRQEAPLVAVRLEVEIEKDSLALLPALTL